MHHAPLGATQMDDAGEGRFCARVARLPSRRWAEGFLSLVGRVVAAAALPEAGDPRFITSVPLTGSYLLPLTINNRYTLAPILRRGQWSLGFLFGPEYDFQPEVAARTRRIVRFGAHRNEPLDTPYWLSVASPDVLLGDPMLAEGWLDASCGELGRARASANHRSHQPAFYRAAWDRAYRERLLDAVFGPQEEA